MRKKQKKMEVTHKKLEECTLFYISENQHRVLKYPIIKNTNG